MIVVEVKYSLSFINVVRTVKQSFVYFQMDKYLYLFECEIKYCELYFKALICLN